MEINHFSHYHPLVLLDQGTGTDQSPKHCCFGCQEAVEGSTYSCGKCRFFLHKKCAELPGEINRPHLHQHPLVLSGSPYLYSTGFFCNLCYRLSGGFAYHCSSCNFKLDIKCAIHPQLVAGDFQKLQHFSHRHALIFVQHIDFGDKDRVCSGCETPMSTPFYCCPDCTFYLHKKCADLPFEINHPIHRKHSLFLLAKSPPHQGKCSCYLCKKSYDGFVYYCSLCEFGFEAADACLQTVIAKIHEHPLMPFPTTNPFICNACGTDGYRFSFPYICSECGLLLHKDCVSLSRSIKITRHHHRLSHIYFFQEKEAKERECNICHDEINVEYGSYCCSKCNYFAHVNCAIDKHLLEEEEEEVGEVEKSKLSALDDSAAFTEIQSGEIKHFAHKHNLIFRDGGVKDGQSCEGCMRLISTSFYYCEECDFFIHEGCAKLLKKVRHWASKHSMKLFFHIIFRCSYCWFWNSGFAYKSDECDWRMCIRCHEILDACTVERHEHPLFFDHKYRGSCCGCGAKLMGGFRCKDKECKFTVDYRCLVLPNTARFKYDNHPLTLTVRDDHDRSQCYCDICEEDRDPNHWFYYCADCDVSAHPDCVLQKSPYVKLGKPFGLTVLHQHLVAFVKIDFNPPKCNRCNKPCRDELVIQCTESDCNYIVHWHCVSVWCLPHIDL